MELTGKIIHIGETETVGTNGFQKRLFVVETPDERYPQKIPLEVVKDKCELLENFSVGQQVTVQFNLRGNEYKGRYYLSAQAWKLEGGTGGSAKPAASKTAGKPASAPKPAAKPAAAASGSDDDVPWN